MNRLLRYFANKENAKAVIANFELYYEELIAWNNKFNLTAITDKEEVIIKHFADSLEGLAYAKGRVCDVGSGAGFPGVPFALADSSLEIVLIDSVAKKVKFLREIIGIFNLNATAEHIRAEDAAHTKYREAFDTVTARALAPLPTLLEYLLPLLKVGGNAIIYKANANEEIARAKNALGQLGGKIELIKEYSLFDSDIKRSLIIVKKSGTTPAHFPRHGNKPRIKPL